MKTNSPQVSIVIPTFNHAHFLNKCLDSLLQQTFKDWEAIVVNNFSQDNTIDVVKAYQDPRIKIVNFNNNGVIAAARNHGIKESQAPFIAFLDSDDWWYPLKLEESLKNIHDHDLTYHDMHIFKNNKKSFRKLWGRHLLSPLHEDLLVGGNPIGTSSVMVRKDVIESVGGFSEEKELVTVEDFDCWIRISLKHDRFKYIKKVLGVYRMGNNNMSSRSLKLIDRFNYVYKKNISLVREEKKVKVGLYFSYIIGRVWQSLGNYPQAIDHFLYSLRTDRMSIKIKSAVFLTMTYWQQLKSFRRHS